MEQPWSMKRLLGLQKSKYSLGGAGFIKVLVEEGQEAGLSNTRQRRVGTYYSLIGKGRSHTGNRIWVGIRNINCARRPGIGNHIVDRGFAVALQPVNRIARHQVERAGAGRIKTRLETKVNVPRKSRHA